MEKTREINLSELFSAVLQKIWLVILLAVVVGGAFYFRTKNFVTPLYRSSVTIYVNNLVQTSDNVVTGVTATNLATSQQLVKTYIEILKSDTVLREVAKQADVGIGASSIRSRMSAAAQNETEVFKVYISHADPNVAAKIANAIADVAPGEIAKIVEGSSTKIIDRAKVAGAPYSPNISEKTTIGVVLGAVIAICIIVLQTLLDVRVKTEEDLALISSAPVLGMIPDLAMDNKNQSGYEYTAKDTKKEVAENEPVQ